MEKTELDRVLDKVQKCLALSKSAEPHEATRQARRKVSTAAWTDSKRVASLIKAEEDGHEELPQP